MLDLTTGSIVGHLMRTAGFMLVTMVFQTLYVLVDLYWVGRLGTEAIAAVAISGNLTFVIFALTQMLGVGTTTLVSHAAGRKDQERANALFNQSQALSMTAGLVFFVVAMAGRDAYAARLAADDLTRQAIVDFLGWYIPAMALQFTVVALAAAMRGTGNFKAPMVVQTATIIVNLVASPILMFGWVTGDVMGVAGAALGTFIAVVVGVTWLASYLLREESYLRFVPAEWWPRAADWRALLRIGLPAGTEFALTAVYLFIVYSVIRSLGPSAQAGFGIGLRIMQAMFLPVLALGAAAAAVGGQNFGARRAERVRETFRSSAWMAAGAMAALAVLTQVASGALVRVFSSDPSAVGVADEYLRIVSWSFVGSGLVFVSSSMFQAIGNTVPPLVTSFVRITALAAALLYLARLPSFGLRWIWYLSVASVALQMTSNLLWLMREFRWRLRFEPQPAAS